MTRDGPFVITGLRPATSPAPASRCQRQVRGSVNTTVGCWGIFAGGKITRGFAMREPSTVCSTRFITILAAGNRLAEIGRSIHNDIRETDCAMARTHSTAKPGRNQTGAADHVRDHADPSHAGQHWPDHVRNLGGGPRRWRKSTTRARCRSRTGLQHLRSRLGGEVSY